MRKRVYPDGLWGFLGKWADDIGDMIIIKTGFDWHYLEFLFNRANFYGTFFFICLVE
jgi:hypothetical protein